MMGQTGIALTLVAMSVLLPKMDYPKDAVISYVQGHSLVRFLLIRKPREYGQTEKLEGEALGRAGLIHFLNIGLTKGWQDAARVVYGYDTIDDLEVAWIGWLSKGESLMRRPSEQSAQQTPKAESETIPPTPVPIAAASNGIPPVPTVRPTPVPSAPVVPRP